MMIRETNTLEYKFNLQREGVGGTETTTRTISLPAEFGEDPTQAQINNALDFTAWAMSSASSFLQTSSWRDDDVAENEWITTSISPTFKKVVEQLVEEDDRE